MVLDLRKEKTRATSTATRMRNKHNDTSCVGGRRCNRTSATNPTSSKIKEKTKKSITNVNKSRKICRRKTRKPKYLSLRLKFSADKKTQDQSTKMHTSSTSTSTTTTSTGTGDPPQLNLFPLHPENFLEDKDAHDDDENMAYLLSSTDGGDTTLNGLLGTADTSSSLEEDTKNYSAAASGLSPAASLTYAYRRHDSEHVALVRTAMRNKGRQRNEEKLVRYSEVVERRDDQEVSSCYVAADPKSRRNQPLSLKLDYEEILNAWSDKGSFFIDAPPPESPQMVPDIHDDFLASEFSCVR